MRITQAQGYREPRDSISQDWIDRLCLWGMLPLLIPNRLPAPAAYLEELRPDLLILTGGDDLGTTPDRDLTETAMLQRALMTGLPVLGVCRGYQLINHFFGGSLVECSGHVAINHSIEPCHSSTQLLGGRRSVNSYHRFTISPDTLARKMIPAATDNAGNVEAAVFKTQLLGIMWHPERGPADDQDRQMLHTLAARRAQS